MRSLLIGTLLLTAAGSQAVLAREGRTLSDYNIQKLDWQQSQATTSHLSGITSRARASGQRRHRRARTRLAPP